MNEILIENPMETINTLLKFHIGDEGRLIYLRNSLKNGKTIFNSDRKFLQRMQEKLSKDYKINPKASSARISKPGFQRRISEYDFQDSEISRTENISKSVSEPKVQKIYEKSRQNVDLEKLLFEISNSLKELKESNIKISNNVEFIINNFKKISVPDKNTLEFVTDQTIRENYENKSSKNYDFDLNKFPKNDVFTNKSQRSTKFKISDTMAWITSGLFIAWFASFVGLIDIKSFEDIILGLSVGLAICVGIIHKLKK